jgi:hydroxymethylbilane synthase
MGRQLRIGTRESDLAVWQAQQVKQLLNNQGLDAELVFIRSEGDKDLVTPLYAIGVQGIFTRALDIALLNDQIDIAVHSMKDVPVQLPEGIAQAAVLERASYLDLLVPKSDTSLSVILNRDLNSSPAVIATSSIRRKAQWLNKFPGDRVENLRGNINTRLNKVQTENWDAAIFAAAGLERINLRPSNAIELDWMLPAPAQGAIMVVCKSGDQEVREAARMFNHEPTAICTFIERAFLSALLGGCSTPISALAQIKNGNILFQGNMLSPDGTQKAEVTMEFEIDHPDNPGKVAAAAILEKGGQEIADTIRHAGI